MSLTRIPFGKTPAASDDLNQIIDTLTGNTGGVNGGNNPLSATAINDALAYALALKNSDAAGKGLIIYGPTGNVLLQANATGVTATPDGVAAAAPIVSTSAAQTLTNKTLTAPVITSPNISGGAFGAYTPWTADVTQGVVPSVTQQSTRYNQQGKRVHVTVNVTLTSAGTAGSPIQVSTLPVPPFYTVAYATIGHFTLLRAGTIFYTGSVIAFSTVVARLIASGNADYLGTAPNFALAAGDILSLNLVYEGA